ncbi:hypothetical protein SMC26_14495 [Actinomadura fulvescens]|uniref:Uncharacterized protein n=1 Tax=Actinomadura fulvescens TaxID=46160 RepID=A0ABP6CCQ8_9ACTN
MFTDFTTTPRAGAVVERLREMAAKEPVPNVFLERLAEGTLTMAGVRGLVGVTRKCHPAEITAFATLMARFPTQRNVEFMGDMVRLINRARPKLRRAIHALGLTEESLARWPADALAWEVPGLWGRLAWLGNRSEAALALYWDMVNYFPDSDEMLRRLKSSGLAAPDEVFNYYGGGQSDDLEQQALLVAEEGFEQGESADAALFAARQMEEAIGGYWHAAARASGPP